MGSEIERCPVTTITVGLDMSLTSSGFCKKEGANLSLETIKTTPKTCPNDLLRFKHIIDETLKRIPENVSLVCVEDFFTPHISAHIGAAIKLIGLGTALRIEMNERGIPFVVVTPTQIKKFATGKGNSPKNLIVREVFKKWGVEAKDDNQADASVLAYIADLIVKVTLNGLGLLDEFPKYQKEVLKKVMKERPAYNVTWK